LPTQADLTVGWGPVSESYTSRLYCVPDEVVEAVSGRADTTIPEATLRKYGLGPQGAHAYVGGDGKGGDSAVGVFDSLVTRWALHPVAAPGSELGSIDSATKVTLSIRFRFTNPAYGLAVGQAADNMVNVMIEAFENRARKIYGGRRADR
jgi:coenzyme Q-binding protein COQ10